MGLLRFVCMIRPETERPAPASTAAITRGILMFQTMRILFSLPFLSRDDTQSFTEMFDEPTKRHTKAIAKTNKKSMRTIALFLLYRTGVLPFFIRSPEKVFLFGKVI